MLIAKYSLCNIDSNSQNSKYVSGGGAFYLSPFLHYIVGMIGTIVTVTLEITNITSSSTLFNTTMYTITVPIIEKMMRRRTSCLFQIKITNTN
jgi:hypothetical protein